jgi:putative resolvase
MNEWVPLREAEKIIGLRKSTIRDWGKKNKIKTFTTPSGQSLYNKQNLLSIVNDIPSIPEKRKIIYCRVSSKKQSGDLERQCKFLQSKYPDHELITDCGSGLNWKRKGLQTILEYSMSGIIGEVVVAHRDRLSRFAFELIEWIIQSNEGRLIVLENDEYKSPEQELAEDLMSIVHVYSCRQMGRRRYSKDIKIENLPNTEAKKDIEKMVRDT